MRAEDIDSAAYYIDRFNCPLEIFRRQEVEKPVEIILCLGGEDYFGHFFGFGLADLKPFIFTSK